jgi:hypothetical protein
METNNSFRSCHWNDVDTFRVLVWYKTEGAEIMIKSVILRWIIICLTGAIAYGTAYGASQFPGWAQIFAGTGTLAVLVCGKLTEWPAKDNA